jgi:hypothetical protein
LFFSTSKRPASRDVIIKHHFFIVKDKRSACRLASLTIKVMFLYYNHREAQKTALFRASRTKKGLRRLHQRNRSTDCARFSLAAMPFLFSFAAGRPLPRRAPCAARCRRPAFCFLKDFLL